MQPFILLRDIDGSGISGTGKVAEGCVMTSGVCVIAWLTGSASASIHESLEVAQSVHGHEGNTRFVFDLIDPIPLLFNLYHPDKIISKDGTGSMAELVRFSNNFTVIQWLVAPCGIEVFTTIEHCARVHFRKIHSLVLPKKAVREIPQNN
jgi:hypothetical protein